MDSEDFIEVGFGFPLEELVSILIPYSDLNLIKKRLGSHIELIFDPDDNTCLQIAHAREFFHACVGAGYVIPTELEPVIAFIF